MRPLPTTPDSIPAPAVEKPTLPIDGSHSIDLRRPVSNQRRPVNVCTTQRAYPWLLAGSTLMAGIFCYLYLSKPVIITEVPPSITPATAPFSASGTSNSALASSTKQAPLDNTLPGDAHNSSGIRATEPQSLGGGQGSSFEETNLRVQHVLGARSEAGDDLGRIILDVPVVYGSGSIRWTQEDVAKARSLMTRIGAYQEKARSLRDEAVVLISEWDGLIVSSIPDTALRADSPTLPENQGIGAAEHASLKTSESIEIETP